MYHMHGILGVFCKAMPVFGWLLMMHCALPDTVVTTAHCIDPPAQERWKSCNTSWTAMQRILHHKMFVPGCCRQAARVGTKMLSMAVQADKLCISANEAGFDDGEAMTDSQVHFIHHITHASHLPLMHACPQGSG